MFSAVSPETQPVTARPTDLILRRRNGPAWVHPLPQHPADTNSPASKFQRNNCGQFVQAESGQALCCVWLQTHWWGQKDSNTQWQPLLKNPTPYYQPAG